MQEQFQQIHSLYVLRAKAALNEFGQDSATYVAYWKIVKALETSDPRKWIEADLAKAREEEEGSRGGNPKLNVYWNMQAYHYQQALQKLYKLYRA